MARKESPKPAIDINADLGESFGRYTIGHDDALMAMVTSANIACGFHAGDAVTMAASVSACLDHGVGIGAHPGFPDLAGFGRRRMDIDTGELANIVVYQIGALAAFAAIRGAGLQHVKLHGAMYNMAATDFRMASTIAEAIGRLDPELIFLVLAGSQMEKAATASGLRVAREIYADREYNPDGTLVARGTPGAVIHDPAAAARRIATVVGRGEIVAIDGTRFAVQPHSICVHGDNEAALTLVQAVRQELAAAGIVVKPLAMIV